MYQIGELAKLGGVSVETLRYYDQQSLLTPSSRNKSGYRLYNDRDKQQLGFILAAKRLGFSLEEIMELLSIRVERNNHSCEQVKQIALHRLQDVEQRIKELQSLKNSLKRVSDLCCGGEESARYCSILDSLEEDNGWRL